MKKLSVEEILDTIQPGSADALLQKERDQNLVALGYNQALLDWQIVPEGMSKAGIEKIVDDLKIKLGMS